MATLKLIPRKQLKQPSYTRRVSEGLHQFPVKLLPQDLFSQMLRLEQRRTERSGHAFLLVLISGEGFLTGHDEDQQNRVTSAISSSIRETDVFGWYKLPSTLGLIMTEIGDTPAVAVESVVNKISTLLQRSLNAETYCRLAVMVRVFPQEGADMIFRVDPGQNRLMQWTSDSLKRTVDIVGSLTAITLLSPLFLVIALAVKCTSKGPVFFCKKRLGKNGKEFSFYKFRTMWVNNNPDIHRQYVAKLISGAAKAEQNDGLYKIKNDPRITPVGRFLRRTSLDELPQFFNVLFNDMSLVGPRPPLPYEFEKYSTWHTRRVLEVKPGITGLWQVEARSLTTFDEMVRIDLRYARARNFWLDLRIMLRTPTAMFTGRGAC